MAKQKITEEMGVQKEWFKEMENQTMKTLPDFLKHLLEDYDHDYGTICHAITAGAIAAAKAMNKSPEGGITGFQAGCIMWGLITNWMTEYKGKPMKLVDYSDMLYPQMEHKFVKTISEDTWKYLQKEAEKKILEDDKSEVKAHPEVREHWVHIVEGDIPFSFAIDEKE